MRSAVLLGAVATRADEHLALAPRTQKQSGIVHRSPRRGGLDDPTSPGNTGLGAVRKCGSGRSLGRDRQVNRVRGCVGLFAESDLTPTPGRRHRGCARRQRPLISNIGSGGKQRHNSGGAAGTTQSAFALFRPIRLRRAVRRICAPLRSHQHDGYRLRFWAALYGARVRMRIDIGFGNAIQPPPIDAAYPTLLDGPRPSIRVYPPEAIVSEKLHAMVAHGELNSRYKDFYDLYALASHSPFEGERLARAIGATFRQRGTEVTEELPIALVSRFYSDSARAGQWRGYLTRNNLPGAPTDFGAVGECLMSFLAAPWIATASGSRFVERWPAGGPWSSK